MPFQYKTLTLDNYFLAGQGDFENVQALDPPNTLSLGLPSGLSLTTGPDFQKLAVLSRIKEGSGNVIGNEGRAGAGTRIAGSWKTDSDGSVYLQNPRITYPHHQSMAEKEGETFDNFGRAISPPVDISAAVRLRNPVQGMIIEKPGLIQFRVLSNGSLEMKQTIYLTWGRTTPLLNPIVYSLKTPAGLLTDGLWHTAGFTMKATSWSIVIDGSVLNEATFDQARATDPGASLYIGFTSTGTEFYTGDLDNIIYMGSGSAISFFNKLKPQSGVWTSPVIDLGDTYVFDSITNAGYVSQDHSASLIARLSSTKDLKHVQPASVNLSEEFVPPDAYPSRRLYPVQWAEGRYAQILISLSQGRSNFSPNLANVQVRFRKRS